MWINLNNCLVLQYILIYLVLLVNCDDDNRNTYKYKFSIEQLLTTTFPKKTSSDIDFDPCKAGSLLGDIALPNGEAPSKLKKSDILLQEAKTYKQEVLEGLQIEEEGLTDYIRRKTKQSSFTSPPKSYNDPMKNINPKSKSFPEIKNEQTFQKTNLSDSLPDGIKISESQENNISSSTTVAPRDLEETSSLNFEPNQSRKIRRDLENHYRRVRAATARKERVWDYGVIPYEIDSNFSGEHISLFKQAMMHWENFTCIKFVKRVKEDHPNYILFTEKPCGCCSFVGKRGTGGQAISIGRNCDKFGIVVHELGHVVGFWHEHTRPDRDKHVNIIRENIMNGQEYNFNKLTDTEVNSLGLTYDYDSIMHYAKNTFAKGTFLDTIQPVDVPGKVRPEIGQRIKLSQGDIAQTNLLYNCPKCGSTLQGNSGTFELPIHLTQIIPKEPVHCEWRITARHGEKIVLNVTLDIAESENCDTDYIEIRDGYWHKSTLVAKYCGFGVMEPILSTGSRMLVTYVAENPQGRLGFIATYQAICGGELLVNSTAQHIESPNYPGEYHPDKECIWTITVPENFQVALKFHLFELENHDNCVYDYIEIQDGLAIDSPLIGRYCGYNIPVNIISSGNSLLLKFVSDASVQKRGFGATVLREFDECNNTNHGCQQICTNIPGGYECSCSLGYELHSDGKNCENACGGIIVEPNGTITSPSFPDFYPLNKFCTWEIVADPLHRVILNFTHFDLEGEPSYHTQQQQCEYDRLEVYSRLGENKLKKHGVYCGDDLPSYIISEGNIMQIKFFSDTSIQKSGFAAVFMTDMDECVIDNGGCQQICVNTLGSYKCTCHNGFTLHDDGYSCKESGCKHEIITSIGGFASPNYPDIYPSKKECIWHIFAIPGHRIRVKFITFDVEPHQECSYDYVDFYDGPTPESDLLGRFCGTKLPSLIISSTNQMYMTFKSDASVQRNGFLAFHDTVCGGILQATTKKEHIYSHPKFGSDDYDNDEDCDWTIITQPGYSVQLTFLTFDLEDEENCSYDYVEIFSGLDSSSPSFGKFCGQVKPHDIVSTNENLLVRFISDMSLKKKGFSLVYEAVEASFEEI